MHRIGLIGLALTIGQPSAKRLEPIGRLAHPAIREASGIVQSRRFPGVFWTHNDSGNPPALFAVTREGNLIREYAVAVPNVDWEDIAIDDAGHLYLGEIGNNDGRLPLRAIYEIDEPDPARVSKTPLPVTKASFYRFPRDGRFDAEGLFIEHGRAIVVAKTFDGREAELFAIPLDPPTPLLRPALPEPVGRLPGLTEPATAADLSRDGRRLAVASTRATRVYERDRSGRWRLVAAVPHPNDLMEALCWDGDDLILASEARGLYRIGERTWRPSVRLPSR